MIGACSRLLGVGGVSARANARYMYLQSGLKKKCHSRRPFWATDLLRSYIRERIHSFPIYRKSFLKVPFPFGSLLKVPFYFFIKSSYITNECSLRKRAMKRPVKSVATYFLPIAP